MTRLIEFYHVYVDMLVDQGRVERALEVSESSRGRVLGERNGLAPPPGQRPALSKFRRAPARFCSRNWLGASRSYVWGVTGPA